MSAQSTLSTGSSTRARRDHLREQPLPPLRRLTHARGRTKRAGHGVEIPCGSRARGGTPVIVVYSLIEEGLPTHAEGLRRLAGLYPRFTHARSDGPEGTGEFAHADGLTHARGEGDQRRNEHEPLRLTLARRGAVRRAESTMSTRGSPARSKTSKVCARTRNSSDSPAREGTDGAERAKAVTQGSSTRAEGPGMRPAAPLEATAHPRAG